MNKDLKYLRDGIIMLKYYSKSYHLEQI